jgi:two-component sensor histidine kinase/CHASE3 domain sensor protein
MTPVIRLKPISRLLFIAGASLAVSLLAVFVSFQADSALNEQARRSSAIIESLENIRRSALSAETGQRGYLLTANVSYLEPMKTGFAALPNELATLDELMVLDPTDKEIASLRLIHDLVEQKQKELEETVAIYDSGDLKGAIAQVSTHRGRDIMNALRAELDVLLARERRLLNASEKSARTARLWMVFTLFGVGIASTVAFAIAYFARGRAVRTAVAEEHAAALQEAHARTELLARELNHRVKNLFAVVMSIISATARTEPNSQVAASKARERVQALAGAHALTATYDVKNSTTLSALIDAVVRTQMMNKQVLISEGPSVQVPSSLITPFGMILHELTTNAMKYGAWSEETGKITIHWESEATMDPPSLVLRWKETAPEGELTAPELKGFGSRMIGMSVAQMKGQHRKEWPPDGMEFFLTIPLESLKA